MKEIRTLDICVEITRECDVKYYVWADPNLDAHWMYEPCFVLEDKYFDTEEEAQAFLDKSYKDGICAILSIGEQVTLLDRRPIVTEKLKERVTKNIIKERG